MTAEQRERLRELDVWEAEARFLGAGEGDVGKMEGLKMKGARQGKEEENGEVPVTEFMKMEKGGKEGAWW